MNLLALHERYEQFATDEERVKLPSDLKRDIGYVFEKAERSVEFYTSKGIGIDQLIAVIGNPYTHDVLIDGVSSLMVLPGKLRLFYEPDTYWAYAGEGYWPGKAQVPDINVMLLNEHLKYCRSHG